MSKDIMDVKEIALYLGFSEKKIRNMIKAKSIPYSKIGGQYRFLKSETDSWLKREIQGPRRDDSKKILEEIKNTSNLLEKRLLFMGALTDALSGHGLKPIMVGGNALEFYTLGGYATGDIDIILPDRKVIDEILTKWNFKKEGRHWFNSDLDIAIEIPASILAGDLTKISEIKIKEFVVYIIGLEDLIIDRLNAFVHRRSKEDGFWAKELILIHKDKIDWNYLKKTAKKNKVEKELKEIISGESGNKRKP